MYKKLLIGAVFSLLLVVISVLVYYFVNQPSSDKAGKSGEWVWVVPEKGTFTPEPSPDGWVDRAPDTQGPGITHYYDCCKETCSWNSNAVDYGVNQCNNTGSLDSKIGPDDATHFPKSVCDDSNGNATCQNRYPKIIEEDGKKVLYGFVASGAELKKDFQQIQGNGSCGQCYEIEFQTDTGDAAFNTAKVQVTNTGDGSGIFDFEIPGGGFGANNGCKSYSSWKVYKTQGGPCADDGKTDTAECLRYGGLQKKELCDAVFGEDKEAATACNDVMFGGMMRDNGNILVKRYRPIACPAWFSDKTGTKGPPVTDIKRTLPIGAICKRSMECSSQNCHSGSCEVGKKPNGRDCRYNQECLTKHCNYDGKCAKWPLGTHVCYYNDKCEGNDIDAIKAKCSTPADYCDKCSQWGEGDVHFTLDDAKGEDWDSVSKRHPDFKNSNVFCTSKGDPPCEMAYVQCAGDDTTQNPPVKIDPEIECKCPGWECKAREGQTGEYKQCLPST